MGDRVIKKLPIVFSKIKIEVIIKSDLRKKYEPHRKISDWKQTEL